MNYTPRVLVYAKRQRKDKYVMQEKTIIGQVSSPVFNRPIIYTDGSVSKIIIRGGHRISGWGYIGTDGKYGLGTYINSKAKLGTCPPVIAELKAIYHALMRYSIVEGKFTNEFTIIYSDSLRAIGHITTWRKGGVEMPDGYTGTTLEKFKNHLRDNSFNFEILHVKGHSGDTMNECADTLAHLGMRWSRNKLTKEVVEKDAFEVADTFLNNKHLVKI